MSLISHIASTLPLTERSIRNTVNLLDQECTIPFIARYRKELTGNLDEVQIQAILKLKKSFETFEKRKKSILKSLEEQQLLSPELQSKIQNTTDIVVLEDLYLPFKKKKNTKASIAKSKGLEPLAKIIMAQKEVALESVARRFLTNDVATVEEAIEGARDIIAEWINEHRVVRNRLRRLFLRKAVITTKLKKDQSDQEEARKYKQYFDWSETLSRCPSHRLLAMLRAERENYIRLQIEVQKEEALRLINEVIIKGDAKSTSKQIFKAAEAAYKRLLSPAISNEVLKEAKTKADREAIKVFSSNLRQLLLEAPLGEKRILAIDPGYRSGCKIVCLDEKGNLKHNETIYPHPPQREKSLGIKKIKSLVNAYKIEAISIGNGTASRETEQLIKQIKFDRDLQVFVVNESGASVYSASSIARKEFPNYDVTVRGAVSIGRRLSDPLAELVKIDPKAIGVGQYQHDVDQQELKEALDTEVMSCVNSVGVNVNTASKSLLSYVSGIGPVLAENIIAYRNENKGILSRATLKEIPRLGTKAFQQSAAFLRIVDAENPMDNSSIHPESYHIIEKMAKDQDVGVASLIGNKSLISKINLEDYCTAETGLLTLNDIVKELEKPGLDPRKKAAFFEFDKNLKSIQDLKEGMTIPGIINNITNFGCFVNIGIKESGLVHISQLSKEFISDVHSVVHLNQQVRVKVLEVDMDRKRIQLSMISD